jgi:hypothetical protein
MPFLRPNIDSKGRAIRAFLSLGLATVAAFSWPYSTTAGIALTASALFVAFEAARGWCVARACGVKTKF